MDCFATLAMTFVNGLLRYARNDKRSVIARSPKGDVAIYFIRELDLSFLV